MEDTGKKGQDKANTFIVNVRYRRNGTWQGTLSWMNGKKATEFRSALEMLRLMEETMEAPEDPANEETFENLE